MGALLVALLQCRNEQSLYPNIRATRHKHCVSSRQPCSVPLLADARHYDQHAHQNSSLVALTTTRAPSDGIGDEVPALAAVAGRLGAPNEVALSPICFAASVSDMSGAGKHVIELSKVRSNGGGTGAEGDAAAAISLLLTTKSAPTPPSVWQLQLHSHLAAAQPAVTNRLCICTPPSVPPLTSAAAAGSPSPTPLVLPQQSLSQTSTTVCPPSAAPGAALLTSTASSKRHTSSGAEPLLAALVPATSTPAPTQQLTPAGGPLISSQDAPFAKDGDSVRISASPSDAVLGRPQRGMGDNAAAARGSQEDDGAGCEDNHDDDELGPMDCADAFQYFFDDDEGAYRDVESTVYAAPHMAQVSLPAMRDYYLNQHTALRAEKESAALTAMLAPPVAGGSMTPAIPNILLLGASGGEVAAKGAVCPAAQLLQQEESKGLYCTQQSPSSLHEALRASMARALLSSGAGIDDSAQDAAAASHAAAAEAQSWRQPEAGHFISLAEEMAAACRRIGAAPFVCWRSIDRVSKLSPHDPLWQRHGNRSGGGGRVDNARGEAEDDTSCPPVSDASHKRRLHYSTPPASDGISGAAAPLPSSQQEQHPESPSLYYLGPKQYMTATVWWSRVEAFGFGLRSMGLRPGDLIGIVEDVRWEWLVTCYAAWSVGLVVVVFDSSSRTIARVAMDTAAEMKALVCSPAVHRALRRHFGDAAAAAEAAACSARTPAACTPTTANDVEGYGGQEIGSGHHHEEGESSEAATATCRGALVKPSMKRHVPSPKFIVVRCAEPLCSDCGDGDHSHPSTTRSSALLAATSRPWRSCANTRKRPSSHQGGDVPAGGHDGDERGGGEEEEEEEALWWSDVLMHGETKLTAWRQRKVRERRLQLQARLRHHQQQRCARASGGSVGADAAASSTRSGASLRRRLGSELGADDLRGSVCAATASQDGSATSMTVSAKLVPTAAVSDSGTTTACAASYGAHTAPIMPRGAAAAEYVKSSGSARSSVSAAARRVPTPAVEREASTRLPLRGPGGGHRVQTSASWAAASSTPTTATPPMIIHDGPPPLPLAPLRPDSLAFILYTEGDPKGVLLTHGAVKASMAAHHEYLNSTDVDGEEGVRRVSGGGETTAGSTAVISDSVSTAAESAGRAGQGHSRFARYTTAYMPALRSRTAPAGRPSYMAYLPLHDICEFVAETASLIRGILVCYGTRRTLFDTWARPHGDLTEYKPTIFPALPATLARLRRTVESMVSTGYRQLLFETAYEARRQAMRRGLQTPFLLSTIFAPSRELLGGRCRLVLVRGGVGAAPLHPRDQEYLEVVCGASLVQSYGVAETAGCGLQQAYCAAQLDSIGGPLGPVHVKMRDVFNVSTTFLSSVSTAAAVSSGGGSAGGIGWTHQSERPTGELLLRGPTIMAGYYRQPERTAAVLEKSGWLHTENVVERCPDGSFRRIASLRPHHATTSNGHCIALEPLEALYAQHPLCLEGGVCVLVHPYRRYICALVLTDAQRLRDFLQAAAAALPLSHSQPSWTALVDGWWPQCLGDPALNRAAATSLAAWATQHGDITAHERVRHVRVLYDTWDVAHHTRTSTGRLLRQAIHYRYSGVIQELFMNED
ncbi:hypothetical protein GH5_08517 [Leishmania sp. Ghana 2012 LV757]|uniref:hypothetical protein n=1 Tax=Leishmania sp. Ghana 2012 LV757 TaxID=2803181 RepID=UPI001B7293DB|nr:hypothetical protein GH5_08517 [Leishmania sp. Ghana 2012 LV757]